MKGEIPFLFLEGVLSFLSPCMLPMLPVYLMYFAAETERGPRASVTNTAGFVAGFTLLFTALGATATAIGGALGAHRLLLQRAGGAVILLFGLHFLGVLRLGFLDVEKKIEIKARRRCFAGAVLFGAAFSLGWTPCLGPFLGSALMLAGARETVAEGVFCLFVFSMGLGLPYILTALFFTRVGGLFRLLRRNGETIKKISGAALAAAGIAILTDTFGYWFAIFL